MDIFRGFGVPVPAGGTATTVAEATALYESKIGKGKDCVIKAMVLAGDCSFNFQFSFSF